MGGRGEPRTLILCGAAEAVLSPLAGVRDTNALPWHLSQQLHGHLSLPRGGMSPGYRPPRISSHVPRHRCRSGSGRTSQTWFPSGVFSAQRGFLQGGASWELSRRLSAGVPGHCLQILCCLVQLRQHRPPFPCPPLSSIA